MKLHLLAAVLSVTYLTTACSSAPTSTEVAPAYATSLGYESMDCKRLVVESQDLNQQLQVSSQAVDAHRNRQTGVEIVTWLLFWPAALALDKGTEHSSKLAKVKGELAAVDKAIRIKDCHGLNAGVQ